MLAVDGRVGCGGLCLERGRSNWLSGRAGSPGSRDSDESSNNDKDGNERIIKPSRNVHIKKHGLCNIWVRLLKLSQSVFYRKSQYELGPRGKQNLTGRRLGMLVVDDIDVTMTINLVAGCAVTRPSHVTDCLS